MMNWQFEGSNDRSTWVQLDKRIYWTGDATKDIEFENEQKLLKQRGISTTWAVDTNIYADLGYQGFRYFRVIQVGKNSSGADNLALSGFELYGRVTQGRWP